MKTICNQPWFRNLALALLLTLPSAALAAPDPADITAMQSIAASLGMTPLDSNPFSPANPWPAGMATWSTLPGESSERLTGLDLSLSGLVSIAVGLDTSGLPDLRELNISGTSIPTLNVESNARLRKLNFSNAPITSTYLGFNTELEELVCENTNLIGLNLSGLSNLALLRCGGNPFMTALSCDDTALTSLDLTGNTALQSLRCYNTAISSLSLTAHPDLTSLICDNTPLAPLDLSGAPNLQSFICSHTLLTGLNLAATPNLLGLYCSDTGITGLNLAATPNLQALDCSYTPITALDLSGNPHLLYLDCSYTPLASLTLGSHPNLLYLICQNTRLASLDMSRYPQLQLLQCANSTIASLNLSGCASLTQPFFEITGNPLTALTTPAGFLLTAGVAGSGNARVADYNLTSSAASLTAAPAAGWAFQQWEAVSPTGLVFTPNAAYTNGATMTVTQPSHLRAVFAQNVTSTPVPTPVPTLVPTRPPSSLPKTGDDFHVEAIALLVGALVIAMAVTGLAACRGKRARHE